MADRLSGWSVNRTRSGGREGKGQSGGHVACRQTADLGRLGTRTDYTKRTVDRFALSEQT